MNNGQLKAYVQNGVLHIGGQKPGAPWAVYNLTGTLIYTCIATYEKTEITLPAKGIYIIMNEKESIKIIVP